MRALRFGRLLMAAMLCGCGADAPPAGPAAPPGGRVQVRGVVYAVSDVQTIPDSPFGSGRVVVVSPKGMEDLRADGRVRQMTRAQHEALALASSLLAADGGYSVALPPGEYVLGLGNLGRSHADPGAFPITVYGWVPITIGTDSPQRVDLFYDGEARRAWGRHGDS